MKSIRGSVRLNLALALFVIHAEAPAQTCAPPPSGMVAWWPGDNDARDIVGLNHGTSVGGVSFGPGKVGQAFRFDGIGSEVSLGASNIVGSGSAPFTVTFWFRPAAAPTGAYYFPIRLKQDQGFIAAIASDYNVGGLFVPGEFLNLSFRGAGSQWWIPFPISSMLNSWSQIAIGYNGGAKGSALSYIAYVNGVPMPTATMDLGNVGATCNDNVLSSHSGSACGGGSVSLRGEIDEVQVFSRVLTQSEIQAIFSAGNAGLCKPVITVTIDIKPGTVPNTINLGSNGVVPVAILSTAAFDATTVDPLTARLAAAPVRTKPNSTPMATPQDVNGDGRIDLLLHFQTESLQLTATDAEAVLEAKTFAGQAVRGVDTVRIVP